MWNGVSYEIYETIQLYPTQTNDYTSVTNKTELDHINLIVPL